MSVDLSPVIETDPLDLRISVSSIVHWADSHEVRRRVMSAVDFPVDDMAMFLVVNQLSYRGAMKPSALSSALGTGRANITKITNRLVEAGLVLRVPIPGDDRSVLVALTAAGRDIGTRILANAGATFRSRLAGWDAADVATLQRLLARLAAETVRQPQQG
ncbi:MarR family winged helix-turn-helix transcriptional regulator [Microbacterium pygmaeum]|uniref:DNA-binding transcriptional regulator, MarR family n=1 Tax=Microbacterium pygmaeum TaxID=370764 RepID=A0A1G7WQ14_9MICO|nr:MarR family transcriptional regulator [Microbacterium pygmaeum]SDG74006.1 DNA-binding transcriptional regulator, MarR family [Microbacterium pygmaeum]